MSTQIINDESKWEGKRKIGSGALGNVYEGEKGVALKIMDKRFLTKNRKRNIVKREIQILQKMKSEKSEIVKYYGYEEDQNYYYLKFKYYQRGTLKDFIVSQWFIINDDPSIGVLFLLQCLFGLTAIHKEKCVHRDFKPENILVEEDNGNFCLKISDFGGGRVETDKMCSRIGTNLYMAPEIWKLSNCQFEKKNSYTNKCDIWSLGITISQIYMGYNPKRPDQHGRWLSNPFWENINPLDPSQVKQYYCKVIYEGVNLPKKMPQFLRILVRKMLIADPTQRISFSEIYTFLLENIKEVWLYIQKEDNIKYFMKINESLAKEKESEVEIMHLKKQGEKMKMLYEQVYCHFIKKVNIKSKCQYILLEFMYLLIKFIIQFSTELFKNDWEKDLIYSLISKENFKKMRSLQYEIEELLMTVGVQIKSDVNLNKKEVFRNYIMKFKNVVRSFIEEQLAQHENIIYRTLDECVFSST